MKHKSKIKVFVFICFFLTLLGPVWLFKKFSHFIWFWLCWVFVAGWAFLQWQWVGAALWLWCTSFWVWRLLLVQGTGSRYAGLSSWVVWNWQLWLTSSKAQARQLSPMGLVSPWHEGSYQIRSRTQVSCIDRCILYPLNHQGHPGRLFFSRV